MSEAVVAGSAALITAGLGVLGVVVAQLYRRLDRLEDHNRDLWAYCRRLLDMYYRYRLPGAPDPATIPAPD